MRAVLGRDASIGGRIMERSPRWSAPTGGGDPKAVRDDLQRAMTAEAGVIRTAASLETARAAVDSLHAALDGDGADAWEVRNLAEVARALVASATTREESRGAHTRTDFPATSDAFRVRLVHQ
jgi:L-aspartate oxidase